MTKAAQQILEGALRLPQRERATVANSLLESLEPSGAIRIRDETRATFEELTEQWREATCFLSSLTDIVAHPAYQRIIGMGREAIPLLLDELKRQPDHLFWALKAITGEDPVPAAMRGDIRAMSEAWLAWGREHGYL